MRIDDRQAILFDLARQMSLANERWNDCRCNTQEEHEKIKLIG